MKKISIGACMAIVFVWFTTLFGGGWATGAQAYSWFARHGWTALWMPLVGVAIMSILGWIGVEYARKVKANHYRAFMESVYGNKWIPTIHEIGLILGTFIGLATVLAAGGSLLAGWGVNYWVGVIIIALICIVGCLFGVEFVRKIASFMGVVIVALIAVVFVIVLNTRSDVVSQIVSAREVYTSTGEAWYSSIYFGATCCGMVITILPVMNTLKSKQDTTFMIIAGFVVNSAIMVMLSYVILAFMPEIGTSSVPFLFAVTELQSPVLNIAYSVILIFAIITTGIGMLYTYAVRFRPWVKVKSEKLSYSIILLVFVVISSALSGFGLIALVAKGYTVTAYINMALVIIGMPIMVAIRTSQMKKREALGEAEKGSEA